MSSQNDARVGHDPGQGDERSISQLMSDVSEQTARLVRTEVRLAAREMAGKTRRAAFGTGALAVAGVLALFAGLSLVACLVLVLATVMAAWVAALVVGSALLLIAGVVALVAKAQLRKAMPPIPDDTIARVREDIDVVKEGAHE